MSDCCEGKTKLNATLWKITLTIAFLFGAVLLVGRAQAESGRAPAAKVKLPHQHGAGHGGQVIMVGDDHLEVVEVGPNQLKVFISDKFRDPVLLSLVRAKVAVVDKAGARKELTIKEAKDNPAAFLVELPRGLPADTKLQLRAPRVTPVKGQVTTENPQVVELGKIPKMSRAAEDHSAHQ